MNWEAIGAIASIIGVGLVVVSLFYVGIQIKQNNKDARSQARQSLLDTFAIVNWEFGNDIALVTIVSAGLHDWSTLSNLEKTRFETVMCRFLQNIEKGILLHHDGVLDSPTLDGIANFMLTCVLAAGGKDWFEQSMYPSKELREYFEKRMKDPSNLPLPISENMPHFAAIGLESSK
jgi:hypothetical protein